jgi:phospholipase C
LRQKLEDDEGKKVVSWSNGNIFRSVTLLAVTWCEQQPDIDGFDKDKALTKENLQSFVNMLSFGKFNDKYDTRINGLGLDMLVSEVQNTELKSPKVSKNIPTVAEVTQGK